MSSMDVVRERPRGIPKGFFVAIGAIVAIIIVGAAMLSLMRGKPSGVQVDRSTIVTDTVRQGTLQRSISASGTLSSQNIFIVAATQPGIIDNVFVKPGAHVNVGDPIAQMSNPDLDALVVGARSQLQVAQAQLASAQAEAKAAVLAQRSAYSGAAAQAQEDTTNLESAASLHRAGFVADTTYRIAAIKAEQSKAQLTIARSQIPVTTAEQDAKVTAAQAQVQQATAELQAKEAQVAALVVRARSSGVVQSVAINPGARIDAGLELARIADQRDLKAVLAVPEGQVHDVAIGMPVRIDTGNGAVPGRVARIAPSAQNGSVAVDVSFTRGLPQGARPDLNVDGAIELETIPDTLSIARPAGATDESTINLYRLERGTSNAQRVQVRLGRGSNDRLQVLSGLSAGDIVIVSDTSAYGGAPTLVLH